MIVVADTSPLNYLVQIGLAEVLPELFGDVLVPQMVLDELSAPETPAVSRRWAASPPHWIRIVNPTSLEAGLNLDPGETAAISLAIETRATLLLIDDRKGRRVADAHGLMSTGTIGVLQQAVHAGLVSADVAITLLSNTNFHATANLIRSIADVP